ncbi:Serine/threonine protein kinase [Alteromonadaceae bacterium Bs31]|nr:Serine/threonine protein kinase [Alteromonadaceae bacterium Bs31]
MRFSIKTKLFLLVFIAFSTLTAVTLWRIDVQADKAAMESINRSLMQSSVILETKLSSRIAAIEETANGIARDGRILPLVFDGQSDTLQDLGGEFKQILEFDILFFIDAEGTVIARPDRPEAIGQSVAGKSAMFDSALAGKASSGVIASRGKLLQLVVVPIFDNVAIDVVRGAVALGYEFSEDMASEIYALTTSHVGFFVLQNKPGGTVGTVKSSYVTDELLQQRLDQYFSDNQQAGEELLSQETIDSPITINGEEYFYVIHPLSNDGVKILGFIMALHSKTALRKPFAQIQSNVLVVGVICLIGALGFALVFAQRISRPIIDMVGITKKIEEGSFQKEERIRAGKDEIGDLYRAISAMGKALGEKAELENYLANIGEDLDADSSISVLTEGAALFEEEEAEIDSDATRIRPRSKVPQKGSSNMASSIIDRRYEIIRPVGAGAIGKVYLARDLELRENLAIKVMEKSFFSEQESIDFREEIRLARKITHRNILRTYDYGAWSKYYYITMEYVQGFDLQKLLQTKGAFNVHVGVLMARQICSAMIAAHEQGIIHRDIKPANILINRQGILKIMDFGLAMRVDKNPGESDKVQEYIAGTPRFMAPEQFVGDGQLDERTDIYAMGAIFFTLFNGSPPFASGSFEELRELHTSAPVPDISHKSGRFPRALQKIVEKAMAKDPAQRYQKVGDILEALNKVNRI